MKWQQNDSTHEATLDHHNHNTITSVSLSGNSTSTTPPTRRKIVSFCKYLCRIFDSAIRPPPENDFENPQLVLSLIDETTLLLEYKYRILSFMNRLMQRYGKRAVECFLGSSIIKPSTPSSSSSSRRHSSSIGYKQVPSSSSPPSSCHPTFPALDLSTTDSSFCLPSLCHHNPST
jgi:hypothetical protein